MKGRKSVWLVTLALAGVLALVLGCSNPLTQDATASPKGPKVSDAPPLSNYEPQEIGGEGSPLTVPLLAGKTIEVGTVDVWLDGECLYVRYNSTWALTETHLEVVADPADFPQTKKGNPIPGHFTYKMTHPPGTFEHTYCIDMTDFGEGNELYFAAHAEVEQWIDGSCTGRESAWADGIGFPGANWATYFKATLTSVVSDNAMLENLGPSTHVLIPAFDPETTSYSMSLGNSVSSIRFTPVAADAGATIRVSGAPVNSGEESDPIPLNVGANAVDVVVTAEDGTTTRTYMVAVNRATAGLNVIWGTISRVGEGEIGPSSPLYVMLINGAGIPTMSIFTEGQFPLNYSFGDLPDGGYTLASFLDKDNNFTINPGDLLGPQPNYTVVGADVEADFTLSQFASGTLTINLSQAPPDTIGKHAYFTVSLIGQGGEMWENPEAWLAFGYFTVTGYMEGEEERGTGSSVALGVVHVGDEVNLLTTEADLEGCYYHVDIFVDVEGRYAYPPVGDVRGILPYEGAPQGSRNDIVNGDSQWDAWVSY